MSGRKRIQVDESAWYGLLRSAEQLREVRRDLPRLLEDVRRQAQVDVANGFADVRDRQQRSEAGIQRLSEQTRALEAETNRRLQQQTADLQRKLTEGVGELRAETREALDAQQRAMASALAAERHERIAQSAGLAQQLGELTRDRARAEELSRTWLADADTITALIAETLPHERYAPGELAAVRTRVAQARENHALCRYDASLAVSQESYHALGELRVRIEQEDLARRSWQVAAVQAAALVERLIEENAERPVLGPDRREIPGAVLDVDYWSGGGLEELRRVTALVLDRARDEATSAQELRLIGEQEVPMLEARLSDAVQRAALSQLASQIRVNLADEVAHVLAETAFYSFEDAEFVDADQRGGFFARLRHENGSKIVIDIEQAEPDSGAVVLRVLSFDQDTESEADQRSRAEAIRYALAERGHQVQVPVAELPPAPALDPTPEPAEDRYDPAAHRRRGARRDEVPGP
ncbi:hypothetical protein OG455_32160 [Kitasatospora sp. NBC_01287]|uniref:hypothetical protein n=1 Tax=Kitasatospora sp. NBC_01287 TaxID=2903573 RepID=UPI00224D772B|nr:hypothetical protein [Kitasatospora sp. NBC_01287]MCX4750117.1 hypothetical protein [Kitasatospora sp. NBC_01287]